MGGHLAAEAGTSKSGGGGDPGLHNKPLGCSASEVYASGPACEEEEEPHFGCLTSGKNPHCPLNARLGGTQCWAENFRGEKNLLHLPE